jgi:hypothetical protein
VLAGGMPRTGFVERLDRVKVWVACDEHRDFLRDYLDTRGFPVVVTPAGVAVESVGSAS